MEAAQPEILDASGLDALLDALEGRGYRVVGPTVRDQAIVYDDIASVADLPRGLSDEQDGGHYRLLDREDDALFGYAVGPHSWKKFLHVPVQRLWRATRERSADGDEDVRIVPEPVVEERFAFIGVRACELHAMAIQDRVLLEGSHVDRHYETRRRDNVIVAVNCARAGGTCFCASMSTGPEAPPGFDLVLTEIPVGDGHRLLVEAGSEIGHTLLGELPRRPATEEEVAQARSVVAETAASMGREMRADDVHDLLMQNLEHPRWQDVADRCLSCGNCTMVCPTCFCTTVEDSSDLAGSEASRTRRWDSCFTMDFSYLHGGSVRPNTRSRYRQWLTHKLATWKEQFGTSGCVGCGRCISWCPVGIDLTEEVRAVRGSIENEE
jgi:ferredoxin